MTAKRDVQLESIEPSRLADVTGGLFGGAKTPAPAAEKKCYFDGEGLARWEADRARGNRPSYRIAGVPGWFSGNDQYHPPSESDFRIRRGSGLGAGLSAALWGDIGWGGRH